MPTAEHQGTHIAYRDRGEGVPVVLLMGLALPGSIWKRRAEELLDRGYRVVVPDPRGTGASDAPWPPYSMGQLAGDVDAVMEDAGLSSGIVVGVSFGGMVAQHVALEHADRVDGLMLVSTTCGLPAGQLPRPSAIGLLLKLILFPEASSLEEAHELLAHGTSDEQLKEFQARVERALEESPTPVRGVLGQLAAIVMHNTGSRLSQIRAPTHVVTGDSDILVPPENSRILADRIPHASLRVLPKAGHIAIHEHPLSLHEELETLVR